MRLADRSACLRPSRPQLLSKALLPWACSAIGCLGTRRTTVFLEMASQGSIYAEEIDCVTATTTSLQYELISLCALVMLYGGCLCTRPRNCRNLSFAAHRSAFSNSYFRHTATKYFRRALETSFRHDFATVDFLPATFAEMPVLVHLLESRLSLRIFVYMIIYNRFR